MTKNKQILRTRAAILISWFVWRFSCKYRLFDKFNSCGDFFTGFLFKKLKITYILHILRVLEASAWNCHMYLFKLCFPGAKLICVFVCGCVESCLFVSGMLCVVCNVMRGVARSIRIISSTTLLFFCFTYYTLSLHQLINSRKLCLARFCISRQNLQ